MFMPSLSDTLFVYPLLPVLTLLFVGVYYGLAAWVAPVILKRWCLLSVVNRMDFVWSGIFAFFMVLPCMYAFQGGFSFLFMITPRSLFLFSLLNIIMQYIYLCCHFEKALFPLFVSACVFTMCGYWMTHLLYYAIPYTFALVQQIIMYYIQYPVS